MDGSNKRQGVYWQRLGEKEVFHLKKQEEGCEARREGCNLTQKGHPTPAQLPALGEEPNGVTWSQRKGVTGLRSLGTDKEMLRQYLRRRERRKEPIA